MCVALATRNSSCIIWESSLFFGKEAQKTKHKKIKNEGWVYTLDVLYNSLRLGVDPILCNTAAPHTHPFLYPHLSLPDAIATANGSTSRKQQKMDRYTEEKNKKNRPTTAKKKKNSNKNTRKMDAFCFQIIFSIGFSNIQAEVSFADQVQRKTTCCVIAHGHKFYIRMNFLK